MTDALNYPEMDEADFGLRVHVLGRTPFLPITESEYEGLKASRDLVRDALVLEEAFHRLLGNFFEYESMLLSRALEFLIFTEGSWSESSGTVHDFNRRLSNLLSAARAYLDQGSHLVRGRFGKDSSQWQEFSDCKSREYDNRLGYRVMEALRNYSQHRGPAVHSLSHEMWADDTGPERIRKNAIVLRLNPSRLRDDGGFKSSMLDELESLGDKVDLRPFVRDYLEGLAAIQATLRDALREDVEGSDGRILAAIERYRQEGIENVVGLAAVKRDDRGVFSESVSLFNDLIERRKSLERRSRRLPHIAGFFTTNEPKR